MTGFAIDGTRLSALALLLLANPGTVTYILYSNNRVCLYILIMKMHATVIFLAAVYTVCDRMNVSLGSCPCMQSKNQ